jgi:hypothetical protein
MKVALLTQPARPRFRTGRKSCFITCEEATRVAVKFTDARDASSPTESVSFYSFAGSRSMPWTGNL